MTPAGPLAGWAWFDGSAVSEPATHIGHPDICHDAAVCFSTAAGREVLRHLERSFLDRRLPPTASDALLRHVEGQRSVVAHLLALCERGRESPAPSR